MTDEEVSLGVSVVLLLLYLANLVYTLVTHRDVFSAEKPEGGSGWNLGLSLAVLIGATAAIALEAELLSGALEEAARDAPPLDDVPGRHRPGRGRDSGRPVRSVLVRSRRQNGASFPDLYRLRNPGRPRAGAAPGARVLVHGPPNEPVFSNPLHLFAIASTAFIVNSIARDGETTWFEGVLLVGVYVLFGLAFFFSAPA